MPGRLDETDTRILAALQRDGRMTNVALAAEAGISAPPCLRRVRALEEDGVIRGYRALVDERKLGYEVTFFAFVQLSSQAGADLAAFAERIRAWPAVRESWTLSGDVDYLLKCVVTDTRAFQAFVLELTETPNVRNVRTSLALDRVKDEPAVPLP